MTADIDILKEGIECLIRTGYYKSRDALLEDAFRIMLEVKPSIKQEMAVELYKSEKVSLSRAAEIAGISIEGFKSLLESRGIKRIVHAPSPERLRKEVDIILKDGHLRNQLSLKSQMACNVARQVSGAYKTLQEQVNIEQTEWQLLEFSPTSATFSFERDFGFSQDTLSITTLAGPEEV
ncbi:MAG: UPF0175 family protein [Methanotrichaceae archaeon]